MKLLKALTTLAMLSSKLFAYDGQAYDVLFALQEVTSDVQNILKDLAPTGSNFFTPPHTAYLTKDLQFLSQDFAPIKTPYQQLGISTSLATRPLAPESIAKIKGLVTPVGNYTFRLDLIFYDEVKNEEQTLHRFIQIFEFLIGDIWYPVINVHFYHEESVNYRTKQILKEVIDIMKTAIILGDFNGDLAVDNYHDIIDEETFPDKINGTSKLDHVFIRDDLNWTIEECPNGKIKNRFISHSKPDVGYEVNNEPGHGKGRYFERIDGKPIISDHAIIIYKVIDRTSNHSFRLGTFNILAPHVGVMIPWVDPRLKDWIVDRGRERIRLLVETVNEITKQCR